MKKSFRILWICKGVISNDMLFCDFLSVKFLDKAFEEGEVCGKVKDIRDEL